MSLRVALVTALALSPLVAAAQPAPRARAAPAPAAAPQRIEIDDADVVEGGLLGPDGEPITARGQVRHSSLIKVRTHFVRELLSSANHAP